MKITSWRNWLRKHFGRFLRPARPRTLAKSACVALGLATAWGGEAKADITFQVSITPAHDLLDAFVYYGTNSTGPYYRSLGPLEAGVSRQCTHLLTPEEGSHRPDVLEAIFDADGLNVLGYAVAGLYEFEGQLGILVSYPDDSLVVNEVTWEDFARISPGFSYMDENELTASYFLNADELTAPSTPLRMEERFGPQRLTYLYYSYTHSYYNNYSKVNEFRDERYVTSYGDETTLVAFGDTRFAGTATVSIVPEPSSTIAIAIVSSGLLVLTSRRTMANS